MAPVRLLRAVLPHLAGSARDGRSPFVVHLSAVVAEHPTAGTAPRLPPGLDPDTVAARVIAALLDDERDLPSTSFG